MSNPFSAKAHQVLIFTRGQVLTEMQAGYVKAVEDAKEAHPSWSEGEVLAQNPAVRLARWKLAAALDLFELHAREGEKVAVECRTRLTKVQSATVDMLNRFGSGVSAL